MSQERIEKYEQEIARLDALYVDLDRLWQKMPRLFWVAALAPVVAYFSSIGWAIVHVLVTGVLVGSQAYLIGLRKSENRWNREQVAVDLAQVKAELEQSR
jgi:hypothetical protein